MKEKINQKIESIIDFIISKPNEQITLDDYTILSSEVRDIRFRKSQEGNNERLARLMAAAFPNADGLSNKL